jgi:hypothetical protein
MSPRSGRLKLFDTSTVRFTDWKLFLARYSQPQGVGAGLLPVVGFADLKALSESDLGTDAYV